MTKIKITFAGILYLLFFIATIVTLFIVYGNINNRFSIDFVLGYALFALFLIFYTLIFTILKSRKLKWLEIRKKLLTFVKNLIIFWVITFILDFIFKHNKIDFFNEFFNAVLFAFAFSVIEPMPFYKKKV
jgi:hypothetical protein